MGQSHVGTPRGQRVRPPLGRCVVPTQRNGTPLGDTASPPASPFDVTHSTPRASACRVECVVLVSLLAACASAPRLPESIPATRRAPRTAYALRVLDVAEGSRARAEPRKCYYVHYTGWRTDSRKLDSSHDTMRDGRRSIPLAFPPEVEPELRRPAHGCSRHVAARGLVAAAATRGLHPTLPELGAGARGGRVARHGGTWSLNASSGDRPA
jgi:hypothetical protein